MAMYIEEAHVLFKKRGKLLSGKTWFTEFRKSYRFLFSWCELPVSAR